jgi:hypothetical protein
MTARDVPGNAVAVGAYPAAGAIGPVWTTVG